MTCPPKEPRSDNAWLLAAQLVDQWREDGIMKGGMQEAAELAQLLRRYHLEMSRIVPGRPRAVDPASVSLAPASVRFVDLVMDKQRNGHAQRMGGADRRRPDGNRSRPGKEEYVGDQRSWSRFDAVIVWALVVTAPLRRYFRRQKRERD